MYQRTPAVIELLESKRVSIGECAYSVITRMELLSFPNITEFEQQQISTLLNRMTHLPINSAIENAVIDFRRINKTKLPDSMIAATAQTHKIELLTLDKQLFNRI